MIKRVLKNPTTGVSCGRCKRLYPFLFLCLLLFALLFFQRTFEGSAFHTYVSSMGNSTRTNPADPTTPEALGGCVVADSYAPLRPGACVLTADGRMVTVPGAAAAPRRNWSAGECEATLHRVAPWLRPARHDLAAAPPLRCATRDGGSTGAAPLFIVEKTDAAYELTEPLWASLSAGDTPSSAAAAGDMARGDESGCPTRYLTASNFRFSNTFNQLQGVVHGMWLAKKLNRTFVVPAFLRYMYVSEARVPDLNGTRRVDFETFFDLTKLRQAGYCIVNYSTFEADMRRRYPQREERHMAFFQIPRRDYLRDAVINGFMDVSYLLAPPPFAAPPPLEFRLHYKYRSDELLHNHVEDMSALNSFPFIMIDAMHAFFIRAPFAEAMRIYSLLEPSAVVAAEVSRVLRKQQTTYTVAFHLRYREGACGQEQNQFYRYVPPPTEASRLRIERSAGGKRSITDECAYTAEGSMRKVQFAMDRILPPQTNPAGVSVFLAADGQRPDALQELRNRTVQEGFRLSTAKDALPPATPLAEYVQEIHEVALDYFLLVRADVLFGNRMSSISQCACLARLGQGRACHGVPTGFLRGVLYPDVRYTQFSS